MTKSTRCALQHKEVIFLDTQKLRTVRDFGTFNNRPQIEAIQRCFLLPKEEIIRLLEIANAYWLFDYQGGPTRPHAKLTSGKCSDGYINCSELFQFPLIEEVMAAQQARILMNAGIAFGSIDWVLSSPMAAITYGTKVAGFLGARFAFTEEKDKVKKLVRFGIKPGETVLHIEELITEATTLRAQQEALLEATDGGAKIVPLIGIFFNRSGETAFGDQRYVPVVDQPMPRWTPEECPLCKGGSTAIPPKKPHSNWELLTGTQGRVLSSSDQRAILDLYTNPDRSAGTWTCTSCDEVNPATATICSKCNTSRQMA